MEIDKILVIPIPFSILLIDPIPYRFSLGKEKKKKRVQTGLLTLIFFYMIFSE